MLDICMPTLDEKKTKQNVLRALEKYRMSLQVLHQTMEQVDYIEK